MKLIKNANGKTTVKISHQEWVQIGKEAGFWDNVQQVGKGVKGIGQGAWNAGAGIVGILGNAYKGLSNGIQQLRARIQQGQVSKQEAKQYAELLGWQKEIIEGIQNDITAANAEFAANQQQTAQEIQQLDATQGPNQPIAASVKPIKLIKKANGKTTIKISESKWQQIGVKNGWIKNAQQTDGLMGSLNPQMQKALRQALVGSGLTKSKLIPFLENLFSAFGDMPISRIKGMLDTLVEEGEGEVQPAQTNQPVAAAQPVAAQPVAAQPIAASVKPIKLIKKANGKTTIKINENKWQQIGLANGWIKIKTVKTANIIQHNPRHKEYPYNLLWNLDYEQDPSEPDIAVEFNYKWDAGSDGAFTQGIAGVEQGRRTESDREPAFDITALKVTAQENTVYGPAGTDITESMETGPIIEIIEDALYEEKRNEELGY